MPLVAAIVASYLLGSIPAAFIAGRVKGIDLRKHGSGNLGATNVIRVLGAKIGMRGVCLRHGERRGAGAASRCTCSRQRRGRGEARRSPPSCAASRRSSATCGRSISGSARAARASRRRPVCSSRSRRCRRCSRSVVFAVVLLTSGFVSLGSLTSATDAPDSRSRSPSVFDRRCSP